MTKQKPGWNSCVCGPLLALLSGSCLISSAAHAQLQFTDVTDTAGAKFTQVGDPQVPIGAGSAWVDVDGDGYDDIYATSASDCNRLYLNRGDGTFLEVPGALGAADCTGIGHAVGAADYDNDGDQDLIVLNKGQNRLFRNMAVETLALGFTDETAAAGLDNDGGYSGGGAAWGDYDEDGFLDLFVTNHIVPPPTPEDGFLPVTCSIDRLWHNNGDGTFTDVGDETGVANSAGYGRPGCGLAGGFSDYDNDGDVDLIVINDFGFSNDVPNLMFRNDGPDPESDGWLFTEVGASIGFAFVQAGMGLAKGDVNLDGHLDYYSTDVGPNELAVSEANYTFFNRASLYEVRADDQDIYGGRGLVGWGTGFFDFNHDGLEDLFVVNGGVPVEKFPVTFGGAGYAHFSPNYLYINDYPNPFVEVHQEVGLTGLDYWRGVAFTDMDGDGDIDIFLSNFEGFNAIYRNDLSGSAEEGNWLKVKVRGTISNRDGIGTRVQVIGEDATQMREIDGGSTYASRNTLTAHFGLGNDNLVDVRATFPTGISHTLIRQSPGQLLQMQEPEVTAAFTSSSGDVSRGDIARFTLRYENFANASRTRDFWMIQITPSGSVNVLRPPSRITLREDFSFDSSLSMPITFLTEIGRHRILSRTGEYPDFTHQDVVDMNVVAPAQ